MKITILNNKECHVSSPDEALVKKLRRFLSFKQEGVEYTPAYKNGWDGITYLLSKSNKFNLGLLDKVKDYLKDNNYEFIIEDKRNPKIVNEPLDISENLKKIGMIPRDHQLRILEATDQNDFGIIKSGTGSGKCNDKYSLNVTEYGLLNYEELIKEFNLGRFNINESKKISLNLSTPLISDKVDQATELYYDGYSSSRKITTQYGFTLTGTPNHQIKIIDENGNIVWRKFEDLKMNDYAIISVGDQLFGKEEISLDDAYWYGLLIGDGGLTLNNQITLTNMDDHILNFSKNYLEKNKLKYTIKKDKNSKASNIYICNKKYRNELYDFGFKYEKSIYKELPISIRKLNKKCLAQVIRGIYETDGWVENGNKRPAICLGLSNKKLIDQIHLILLNFGIVASRRVKKTTHEDCHILTVYREFIPIFMKEIGLDPNGHKYKKILEFNFNYKKNTNTNLIPHQNKIINNILQNYQNKYGKNNYNSCPIKYSTLRSWGENKFWRLPSKNNLKNFLNWFCIENKIYDENIDKLLSLCDEKLHFFPIKNIEETQSDNYDFFIPNTHSFVSQGFINHNTLVAGLITAKKNTSTIINCISIDLLDQFHKLFSQIFDEPIGKVGNGQCDIQRITIASVWTTGKTINSKIKKICDDEESYSELELNEQNKVKFLKHLKEAKLHLFDESHIATCDTLNQIYSVINPNYMYGLSGSPFTFSNSDILLESIFGKQIIDVNSTELIEKKLLAQPIIKFVPVPKVLNAGTTYLEVYKNSIVENDIRNNLIVKYTKELLNKKYIPLLLFRQIKHGNILYKKLTESGIKVGLLSGNDSLEKRNKVKDDIYAGTIQCILASSIFDTGIDLPIISGLILCSGGKSWTKTIQRIGRATRMYPGKKHAAVVEFYDQAKFLKNHSLKRAEIYETEPAFKVIKCQGMK